MYVSSVLSIGQGSAAADAADTAADAAATEEEDDFLLQAKRKRTPVQRLRATQ